MDSNPLRLPLQPEPAALGQAIGGLEEGFGLVAHLVVVGVDPGALGRGEEVGAEKAAAERDHGDVLEAEVGLVAEGVRGGDFARHDDVWGRGGLVLGEVGKTGGGGERLTLDAHAKVAVFVVARFWIRDVWSVLRLNERKKINSVRGWSKTCVPSEMTLPAERATSEYWIRVPMPIGPSWTFCHPD